MQSEIAVHQDVRWELMTCRTGLQRVLLRGVAVPQSTMRVFPLMGNCIVVLHKTQVNQQVLSMSVGACPLLQEALGLIQSISAMSVGMFPLEMNRCE